MPASTARRLSLFRGPDGGSSSRSSGGRGWGSRTGTVASMYPVRPPQESTVTVPALLHIPQQCETPFNLGRPARRLLHNKYFSNAIE